MAGIKTELTTFLNELWQCVDGELRVAGVKFQVSNEKELEKFIGVEEDNDRTLLQILGYTKEEVDSQPTYVTVIGHNKYRPDYVLHRDQKPTVIVDLKSPKENLADPRWVEQIDSYCRAKRVPFGLLFNGVDALLFVNLSQVTQVNRAELKKYVERLPVSPTTYAEHLVVPPIMGAQRPALREMAELLNVVSTAELTSRDEAVRKASGLVRQRLRELKQEDEWLRYQEAIRARLVAIQGDQTALGKMLLAACSADKVLRAMKPKPSASDLLAAWQGVLPPEPPRVEERPERSGANIRLKEKLAEVCAAKGWDESWAKQIKGFRYRLNGVEDKGYRRMKQSPGVPPGFCIPGYQTPVAEAIIKQLDQLLKKEEGSPH